MLVSKYSASEKTQADGIETIELTESGFKNQLAVGGTATSGTLTFEYKSAGTWFTLVDSTGDAISVDMASNTDTYTIDGCIDAIRVTPASIAGGYYTVEVISEVG